MIIGEGLRILDDPALAALSLEPLAAVTSERVTHLSYRVSA